MSIKIGILAFQGAFEEHRYSLERAYDDIKSNSDRCITLQIVKVIKPNDLIALDGLILPGGESTTMSKFVQRNNFKQSLDSWMKGRNGTPQPVVWGTCAGMILLANHVSDMKIGGQITIGGLDITVNRNTYGRQNESFESYIQLKCAELVRRDEPGSNNTDYRGIFIRAPSITSIDDNCIQVLAELEYPEGTIRPVAVRGQHLMATSFHPELIEDYRWHIYFLQMIITNKEAR